MGYYMRFIVVDEEEISLSILDAALKQTDALYQIERDEEADDAGALTYDGDVYGEIEINRSGNGIFDEEIDELKELAREAEGERRQEVLSLLNRTRTIVVVRVLWQGRESEETLEKIDPLWQWLFAHQKGLLQAGGEGYYDASGLVLEVK